MAANGRHGGTERQPRMDCAKGMGVTWLDRWTDGPMGGWVEGS